MNRLYMYVLAETMLLGRLFQMLVIPLVKKYLVLSIAQKLWLLRYVG